MMVLHRTGSRVRMDSKWVKYQSTVHIGDVCVSQLPLEPFSSSIWVLGAVSDPPSLNLLHACASSHVLLCHSSRPPLFTADLCSTNLFCKFLQCKHHNSCMAPCTLLLPSYMQPEHCFYSNLSADTLDRGGDRGGAWGAEAPPPSGPYYYLLKKKHC